MKLNFVIVEESPAWRNEEKIIRDMICGAHRRRFELSLEEALKMDHESLIEKFNIWLRDAMRDIELTIATYEF